MVTGAASGIGAACVGAFQRLGATVVGIDIVESSPADLHIQVDLGSQDAVYLVESLLGELPVDGLVNNAAVSLDRSATEVGWSDFDRLINVNLRAPFFLSSALHKRIADRMGFIVNVASVHAVATSKSISVYAASKGGLVALTRALAIEWAPDVRVNAVLPGAIGTGMLDSALVRNSVTREELGLKHPLERVGEPAEVADAVIFLALNTFTTGATLIVDGGATARLSTE